jgi:hypothetical protein
MRIVCILLTTHVDFLSALSPTRLRTIPLKTGSSLARLLGTTASAEKQDLKCEREFCQCAAGNGTERHIPLRFKVLHSRALHSKHCKKSSCARPSLPRSRSGAPLSLGSGGQYPWGQGVPTGGYNGDTTRGPTGGTRRVLASGASVGVWAGTFIPGGLRDRRPETRSSL